MKMTLFESFGPIVASRNVPFICLWVRNPACTLQAWMGDNRESKLRPKKHCKSSPFLPFANRIPSIEKCVNFATLAIFGSILPYLFSNILNLPHIGDFFRDIFVKDFHIVLSENCVWCFAWSVFCSFNFASVHTRCFLLIICYLSAYLLFYLTYFILCTTQ